MDGSQVESMLAVGKLEELAAYCETDIFVTYLLFLRLSLVIGGLGLESYASSLTYLRQHSGSHWKATSFAGLARCS
jgi:predicted PolB exonuclease-like 3'-5' exonuclease